MNRHQVWIVEDDEDDVLLYTEVLHEMGILSGSIRCFTNGQDLLEKLMGRGALLPSLVLLDGRMPQMNGIEVIKALYGFRILPGLPVALLSDGITDLERAIAHKCGVFVHFKPSSPRDLRELFKELLHRSNVLQ